MLRSTGGVPAVGQRPTMGRPLQRLVSVAASQDCVSRDALGGPFCHMQAGVITPEVGGADMQRGGVG